MTASDEQVDIEQNIIDDDKNIEDKEVLQSASFKQLFSTADSFDFFLMFLGTLGSFVTGVCLPISNFLYGELMDAMNEEDDYMPKVVELAIVMIIVGVITIVSGFFQVYFWTYTGERQAQKIRMKYIRSILSQDIGWYDVNGSNTLISKLNTNINKIQDGIGRKIGDSIQYLTQFIVSYVLNYVYEWKLSSLLLVGIPLIGLSSCYLIISTSLSQGKTLKEYAKAGNLVNETLNSFRTVTSLNLHSNILNKYRNYLYDIVKINTTKGINIGLSQGCNLAAIFVTSSLAFWYGSELVAKEIERDCEDNCLTGGDVTAIFFNAMTGSMAIGQLIPPMNSFFMAKAVAYDVFSIIERIPLINNITNEGLILEEKLTGKIKIDNIHFAYPSRPNNMICKGYNLDINPGESIALVGESGSGKSTLISLLLRFYNPYSGSIKIDGHDISKFNIKWLRSQIGYVGQEPVLFPQTIAENIAQGLLSTNDKTSIKLTEEVMEQVIIAAKLANAHDFITKFPNGYQTDVGGNGGLISGGQKQRIAIARALISKPSILLLDEATSALDVASEKIVQESIDKLTADKKQTTIIIAHRLSTIKNVDKICVIKNGVICEVGKHDELISARGAYYDLIKLQLHESEDNENKQNDSEDEKTNESNELINKDDQKNGVSAEQNDSKENEFEEFSKEKKFYLLKRIFFYILQFPDLFYTGLIGALLAGTLWPLWGYILGYTQDMFYTTDPDQLREDGSFYAGMLGILAAASIVFYFLEYYGVIILGEYIAASFRSNILESYMRQSIYFYDKKENDTGSLAYRLSNEVLIINKAFGESLVKIMQAIVCLIVSIAISFSASWEMSLLLLGCVPFYIAASVVQMHSIDGSHFDKTFDIKESKLEKRGLKNIKLSTLVSLTFNNIRTVYSFNMQDLILHQYNQLTHLVSRKRINNSINSGLAYGFSNFIFYGIYSVEFIFGCYLLDQGKLNFLDFMISMTTLMFGAIGLGSAISDLSDQGDAIKIVDKIFKQLDEAKNSQIDSLNKDNINENLEKPKGSIELKNVSFNYETRPNLKVCENYNLKIAPGEVIALVGPSGSGKSTIINLLLRFYNPNNGEILLDDKNIKDYNISWLRSQIGYVGQEPVLFQDTIAKNILNGLKKSNNELLELEEQFKLIETDRFNKLNAKNAENPRSIFTKIKNWFRKNFLVTDLIKINNDLKFNEELTEDEMEQVINAAKLANAHDFITKFSNGYQTDVGEKSMLLSGGQKQRIAIARALISKPSILLLDEATSALDVASEKIVQESIDKLTADKKQTTIIIAHRLSTIKNVDRIYVIKDGMICEVGNHDELLSKNGIYYQLWNKQNE